VTKLSLQWQVFGNRILFSFGSLWLQSALTKCRDWPVNLVEVNYVTNRRNKNISVRFSVFASYIVPVLVLSTTNNNYETFLPHRTIWPIRTHVVVHGCSISSGYRTDSVTRSDSSCFGHYNRSCLLTYCGRPAVSILIAINWAACTSFIIYK